MDYQLFVVVPGRAHIVLLKRVLGFFSPDTACTSITERVGFIKNKLVNLPGRLELSQLGTRKAAH
jgi:hypothetical protein